MGVPETTYTENCFAGSDTVRISATSSHHQNLSRWGSPQWGLGQSPLLRAENEVPRN